MFLAHSVFLAHHVYGGHPFAALFLYLLAAAVWIGILVAVTNARGRSALWSLLGLRLIPGLLIGLLILIALPANTQPPTQPAA